MLRKRWRPLVRGVRCDAEMAIEALSVKVNNEDRGAAHVARETKIEFDQFWSAFDTDSARLRGRDQLIAAACPDLASMFLVKLAMVPAPPSDPRDLTVATWTRGAPQVLTLLGGVSHVDGTGMRVRGESHMLLVGDAGTGKSQATPPRAIRP